MNTHIYIEHVVLYKEATKRETWQKRRNEYPLNCCSDEKYSRLFESIHYNVQMAEYIYGLEIGTCREEATQREENEPDHVCPLLS